MKAKSIKKEIKVDPEDSEMVSAIPNKKEIGMKRKKGVKKECNVKSEKKSKTDGNKSKGGAKVPENKKKILVYVAAELRNLDRKIISKQELAEACGYTKPGSHGFSYAFSELKAEGMISVEKGGCRLTDQGIESVPDDQYSFSQPKTNEEKQEYWYQLLRKKCKEGTDAKVRSIFDVLSDGKSHTLKEFTNATGYENYKSKGLGYNLTCMVKVMKIAEKVANNAWRFTDKCFPEGRSD